MAEKTVEQVQAQITALHARSEPLREQRDRVHLRQEALKLEARELTRQINAIEQPMQELQFDLRRATKLSGREVVTLPSTPPQ